MATLLNELVCSATAAYLSAMDMSNVPSLMTIGRDLLEKVNRSITTDTFNRDNRDKLSTLKTLTHGQVTDIMLTTHRICHIVVDAIRAIARQYNYALTIMEFKEGHGGASRFCAPTARRHRS